MKLLGTLALSISLLAAGGAQADEVLSATNDNTAGKAVGGLTGVMVGGALGGPAGALIGAGVGWLAGWGVQEGTGLSENAYRVRTASGDVQVVRSPNRHFAAGEQVDREGGRLYASGAGKDPARDLCQAPTGPDDAKC